MPLKHVSMWTEYGWRHVTPYEAARIFPNGAARDSMQFLCEACGQYAAFANRAYYLTHGSGSDDCIDKSTSDYYQKNRLHFSLPLKIDVEGHDLEISIGFPSPSARQMQQAASLGARVAIECVPHRPLSYLINEDRFSTGTCYLPIHNEILREYKVSVSHSIPHLSEIWPPIVKGFAQSGTLFDEKTGLRLPASASVGIGQPLLLVVCALMSSHPPDIQMDFIMDLRRSWRVYRVTALKLSKSASEFMIEYGAMLADVPIRITPIWPPVARSSHTILNASPSLMLISRGGGCAEVYPPPRSLHHFPIPGASAQLHDLHHASVQQVLTLSRFHQRGSVQQYLIMNEATPHEHRRVGTNVIIRDERNAVYEEGVYDRLPPKRQITITTGYDGWIEVWRCGRLMDTSAYTALTDIIRPVDWQMDIRIYQGLDLCAQLRFERPVQGDAAHEDEAILNALKTLTGRMIPMHHSAGSIAPKMRHLPKTTSWFRKQMRAGRISETALRYLQKQVGRHQ